MPQGRAVDLIGREPIQISDVKGLSRWRHAVALAAIGAVVGSVGLVAGGFGGLQEQAEDLLQPGIERSDEIAIVTIDRDTLAAIGAPWPWDRARHARLIDAIAADGPTVIVYDVLFADSRDDDDALAESLRAGPVVLASALTLRPTDGPPLILDALDPAARLASAAATTGHANVTVTPDRGVVRSLPLYALDDRGLITPSLALAAVGVIEGTQQYVERPGGIQVGTRLIPLDDADLRINWSDELVDADRAGISAIDVLRGEVEPGAFRNRTVVIGVTEPTLGDLHLVPNDKSGSVSGLLVHANALNTIVNNGYLDDAGRGIQLGVLTLLAVVVAVAMTWAPLRIALVGATGLAAGIVGLSTWRFHAAGELWDIVWPLATIVIVTLAGASDRYVGEIRHRRRAATLFASYVRGGTLDQLADPLVLDQAAAGERLSVTVLFCDLRGFTPIAAELTAEEVRRLLEVYYDYTTSIVDRHDGTVMQFVGDEVFAVFGAPIPAADDPQRAIDCALALVGDIDELDRRLEADGLPPIRFGIGLNRGEVVAAHVGGTHHRQYTVIGDPVNVGSRLCGRAAAGQIVASDAAIDGCDTTAMTRFDGMELKGVDGPLAGWRTG